MASILDTLRGGLVVSCQPVPHGPLDHPEITAAFALAALDGGAIGLRIEGVMNLRAVRKVTSAPIIGLMKVDSPDTPIRITPTVADVRALVAEGADIIAFDATNRPRPEAIEALIEAILHGGAIPMADCAEAADGARMAALGVPILGSTLSGYTGGPIPPNPDLGLVTALAKLGRFTIAEGRYQRPNDAAAAIQAGADSVVVGSAITRPEHVTTWFADALHGATAGQAK